MCTEFYCPNCRRHKPVALKSTRKAGSSYICTACIDGLKKRFAPKKGVTAAGKAFTIANEHVFTARIHKANKLSVQSARRLENFVATVDV